MLFGECNGEKSVLLLAMLAGLLTIISKPFEKIATESEPHVQAVDFDFSFDFDDYIRN